MTSRSGVLRFWLSFHLPTRRCTGISMPTMARSIGCRSPSDAPFGVVVQRHVVGMGAVGPQGHQRGWLVRAHQRLQLGGVGLLEVLGQVHAPSLGYTGTV
jgi:hypothetical protein